MHELDGAESEGLHLRIGPRSKGAHGVWCPGSARLSGIGLHVGTAWAGSQRRPLRGIEASQQGPSE